jgi:Nuclease-related domain
MAKILGQSGRYVSDEVVRQRRRIMVTVWVTIALLGVAEGIVLSTYIPLGWLTGWGKLAMVLAVLVGIWGLDKLSGEKLAAIERKRDKMLRGATGEIQVGIMLTKLSDDFCVINDLATPNGNIDHVVVGPTGIFVLDTKA